MNQNDGILQFSWLNLSIILEPPFFIEESHWFRIKSANSRFWLILIFFAEFNMGVVRNGRVLSSNTPDTQNVWFATFWTPEILKLPFQKKIDFWEFTSELDDPNVYGFFPGENWTCFPRNLKTLNWSYKWQNGSKNKFSPKQKAQNQILLFLIWQVQNNVTLNCW